MDTTPLAQDLWSGIGGHFDSITQVICEFIDNSISNFEGKKVTNKSISIKLEEKNAETIQILIEDTGTGIGNFQSVLRLGDKSAIQTPLNEHGFGLKHALATANPDNDCWKIYSRTKDEFRDGKYNLVEAPFSFSMDPKQVDVNRISWPGLFNGSGTIIEFECSRTLFNTVQRGIRGLAGFNKCLDYLREELGYIYSGVIEKGIATITIISNDYNNAVQTVKPDWKGFYEPKSGTTKLNLGGGELTLEYQFGEMGESSYVKHYKRNMSTSGVEIRVNGRIIMSNIFKAIWEIEPHPSYNHFLAMINLSTQNRDALPKTRTSKNGIRSGDDKLENLFQWIKSTHPTPHKDLSGAVSERELVVELASQKEKHIRDATKHIEREFKVFTRVGSPVSVDLYVFDGKEIVLYEAKKDIADVQNLYQLLMYWDGAVSDGLNPTEGILLAANFSPGVDVIMSLLNSLTDQNGQKYKFSKKTWMEEGVPYPKP